MTISLVDHINIATEKLEETKDFFVEVMGLTVGDRPPFSFPGYWLYAGDRAIVHMQLAPGPVTSSHPSALNHFAFEVDQLDDILRRLDERGVPYRAVGVPGRTTQQAFFDDPNGVRVELNYKPD